MLTKSELAAFVADLRTNGHLQGRSLLCQDAPDGTQKFCCLGRLAELHKIPRRRTHEVGWAYIFEYALGTKEMTGALAGELGYKLGMGIFGSFREVGMPDLITGECHNSALSSANDNGATFAEIADHLERYYPAIDDPVETTV